ncbi:MAG: hypothetical protein U9P70_00740 [Patescibacteria group bacterium]|nr:hypothetical protein [Patescibacteria group bacterium]
MIKKYQENLKFNDYLTMGDHGRTGVFAVTNNCDVLTNKIKHNWNFENTVNGFWLRSPDISLSDITEPFRIYQFGDDDKINFAYLKLLKNLKEQKKLKPIMDRIVRDKKYCNFDFYISEGQVLENEIRIGGSDERVHNLARDVFKKLVNTKEWTKYQNETITYLGATRKILVHHKDINDFHKKSIKFIKYLNQLGNLLYLSEKVNLHIVNNIIEQLPDYDILIFLPTGCYKYITLFLNEDTVDKIMLWEFHIDRNQNRVSKALIKNIKGKRCLIIDKSYTGKTLNSLANFVKKEGGKPVRLALFPKNKVAVKNSEYILFLDRIIKSDTINLRKNWAEKLYKKIMSIK